MAAGPNRQDETRERVDDEAASWIMVLRDGAGDAELMARHEAWRTQSALHRDVWARTEKTLSLMARVPTRHQEHWAAYRASAKASPPTTRSGRRVSGGGLRLRYAAGAAMTALAACLLPVFGPVIWLRLQADITTSTAEVRTLVLEDGSKVHLAPNSALDVSYDEGRRRIRLLAGQAFFEVVPNRSRPFSVAAGNVVATVLGTSFDVRREEAGASVAVKTGLVSVEDRVTTPPIVRELTAGDAVRIGSSAKAEVRTVPVPDIGGWWAGQLVARDRPISEIVDQLRGYYGGAIVLADPAFANLEVSGVYDLRDPLNTLEHLARLYGATLWRVSPWLVVVTRT